MGTRSTIALEYADGTVHQVYCHWDGYLDHNGRILFEHYKDPYKLRDLMDLGAVSSLGREIGEKHPFSPHGSKEDEAAYNAAQEAGWCTIYARDRGETDVGAHKFKDFTDYLLNHQYEEFEYILRLDGKWYVATDSSVYTELKTLLLKETA
jgi:hypothetical protein